jgi:hypothetical protein
LVVLRKGTGLKEQGTGRKKETGNREEFTIPF